MSTPQFLQKDNIQAAGNFVSGVLWQDFKRALLERRPEAAVTNDTPDTAAAKGHQRRGYELCIEAIEALPFEVPESTASVFDRPAVTDTTD